MKRSLLLVLSFLLFCTGFLASFAGIIFCLLSTQYSPSGMLFGIPGVIFLLFSGILFHVATASDDVRA